jgi:hypothetical protein
MGNIDQQRGKNKPPHRGGGEDARKQHAPSRHGHEGPGQGEKKGAHHREEQPEPSETDFPNQQRSPSEELSSDEDHD